MCWLNCKDGPSRCREQTGLPLSVFSDHLLQISRYEVETRCRGQEGLQDAASENTLCSKTKRRGCEDEARKRIRDSHTQRKNDETVFGIVPGLQGVIPVVEHLDERANKAGEQSERSSNSRSARTHEKSVP